MSGAIGIVGGGGHAKVVIAAAQAAGYVIRGVFDDAPGLRGQSVLGVPVLGPIPLARELGAPLVIAVGDNRTRQRLATELGGEFATIVHPRAWVHETVELGAGTVVFAGAVVQPLTVIGAHVILNTATSVDHDSSIGDYVHLAPGVHLGGDVKIGAGSFLGVGCSVTRGLRIGSWSVIGVGSVCVREIPDRVIAYGVPARPRRDA